MSDITKQIPTISYLRTRRTEILQLVEQHGAYNVRVFGSVARGEATTDSDIDLLVATKQGVSVFEIVSLWQALQDLLGYDVSLITEGIDDKKFLERIQSELVIL